MRIRFTAIALGVIGALASTAAFGSQITYHPVNPTFGGNPLNGSYLLSQAQAQGNGLKSGAAGPDLSGLGNALSGIGAGSGPVVIIGGDGNNSGGGGGTGTGTGTGQMP